MFVFVGLGSNQGDRLMHLRAGINGFARLSSTDGLWQSPVYESAPMYLTEQPAFLNMVIGGAVDLEPWELLTQCKQIEHQQGRDLSMHAKRNGPRPLDMDILLAYEGQLPPSAADLPIICDTPELIIPHPRMAERAFVLYPLRDLAANLVHPTLRRTIAALAEDVAGQVVHPLLDSDLI
jgi:2-amino-4-hydroxy-6-hydroxymethyldihydropteridine diphosphokinase